jgi:predicted nucleic acid-binding protein
VTAYLLDTNVVSELKRPRPSTRVLEFIVQVPLDSLFLSDIVIAEIRFGIEIAKDVRRRNQLGVWLDEVIRPMYAGRILPLTEAVLLRWRVMLETCRKRGSPVAEPDLMMAATAAEHRMTIVTRDTAPYRLFDLPVLDPWRWQG